MNEVGGRGAFLFGLALAGFLVLPSPREILVDPCPAGVTNYKVGVEKTNLNHRGNKAGSPRGMRLVDSSPVTCERVSSIYVFRSIVEYVEFGWYENPPAEHELQCGHSELGGKPILMNYYEGAGYEECAVREYELTWANTTGVFNLWTINNPSNDDNFFFEIEDRDLIWLTPHIGWANGHPVLGTERSGNDQHAHGRFDDMYYQNYSGWHLWDQSCFALPGKCDYLDNDALWAAYRMQLPAHYDIEIRNSPP